MTRITFALALLLLLSIFISGQTTRLVPSEYPTIQSAIDVSFDGDTIVVAPGTYSGLIDYRRKKLTIESESGPEETFIDGRGQGPVITMRSIDSTGMVFRGFTVKNARASFGAAISIGRSDALIENNIFENNYHSQGGGGGAILINVASPIIRRNVFRNNSCSQYYNSSSVLRAINGSSPLIVNNIFSNNNCRAINISLPEGNQPKIFNNTIVGNADGVFFGYTYIPIDSNDYRNNIIVGNGIGVEVNLNDVTPAPLWKNNLVYGNVQNYVGRPDIAFGNGNISVDPMFVDPENGDYRLRAGSPAIDAGDSSTPDTGGIDLDGNQRRTDGIRNGKAIIDIGAFEFQPKDRFASLTAFATIYPGVSGNGKVITQGNLQLATTSDGIQPNNESITVRVGDYRGTIFEETVPSGSFAISGKQVFRYSSTKKSGIRSFTIQNLGLPGMYGFQIIGTHLNIRELQDKHITVHLRIGNDEGSVTVPCYARSSVFTCQ